MAFVLNHPRLCCFMFACVPVGPCGACLAVPPAFASKIFRSCRTAQNPALRTGCNTRGQVLYASTSVVVSTNARGDCRFYRASTSPSQFHPPIARKLSASRTIRDSGFSYGQLSPTSHNTVTSECNFSHYPRYLSHPSISEHLSVTPYLNISSSPISTNSPTQQRHPHLKIPHDHCFETNFLSNCKRVNLTFVISHLTCELDWTYITTRHATQSQLSFSVSHLPTHVGTDCITTLSHIVLPKSCLLSAGSFL